MHQNSIWNKSHLNLKYKVNNQVSNKSHLNLKYKVNNQVSNKFKPFNLTENYLGIH